MGKGEYSKPELKQYGGVSDLTKGEPGGGSDGLDGAS